MLFSGDLRIFWDEKSCEAAPHEYGKKIFENGYNMGPLKTFVKA